MKKNMKLKPLILLAGGVMGVLLVGIAVEFLLPNRPLLFSVIFEGLLLAGMLFMLFLMFRVLRFYNRVYTLLRRLLSGDYEVGLPTPMHWKDEFTALEDLLNQVTDTLRQYDVLRINRIRQLRMTLDLVLQYADEPMGLFEVEKGAVNFNPAMMSLLNTDRNTVKLETLRNLKANQAFVDLLVKTIETEKSSQQGTVSLQLPGQEIAVSTNIYTVPYKGKDETVSLAIVYGNAESKQNTKNGLKTEALV